MLLAQAAQFGDLQIRQPLVHLERHRRRLQRKRPDKHFAPLGMPRHCALFSKHLRLAPGEAGFGIDAQDAQRWRVRGVAISRHFDDVIMLNCLRHITG